MPLFTKDQLLTLRRAHQLLADAGSMRVSVELRCSNMSTHWHAQKDAEATIRTLATLVNDVSAPIGQMEGEE
jgi:hypothetical protein